MSLLKNKNSSPKVLQNKLFQPCHKSVSSYLKELESKELTYTSGDAIDNSEETSKYDPTILKNVLNALKGSSKGSLQYPQDFDAFDNSTNVCDFKYIGNLSHLELSTEERNSFHEKNEKEEEIVENQLKEIPAMVNPLRRLDEELDSESDDDELLSSNFINELWISQLQIENERAIQKQIKCRERKEYYEINLRQIHQNSFANLDQQRKAEKELRGEKESILKNLDDALNLEIDAIECKYEDDIKQRRARINQEIEEMSLENAKNEAQIELLVTNLRNYHDMARQKLNTIQKRAEHYSGTELHKILFRDLPAVVVASENSIDSVYLKSGVEEHINHKLNKIKESLAIIDNISKLLDSKEEKEAKEAEVASQAKAEEVSQEVRNSAVGSTHDAVLPSYAANVTTLSESITNSSVASNSQPTVTSLPQPSVSEPIAVISLKNPGLNVAEMSYYELKNKYLALSIEADKVRENVNLRPLLTKAVGIINQLNNTRHDSSNRGKLQQIMNLISGRNFTFGDKTVVSTQNNPAALAFVKEQLAARLVSLSHDIQVSTMAVYASFIVRLWQQYPDLGELILYKLYETCPLLVPLTITRKENQTDEEFNRTLGFRYKDAANREAIDQYLTRMGATAQLFGWIVAMEIDNHPHGIEEGWKFLARTLSTNPFPSITAALLNGFLSIAGHALNAVYKSQFKKLILYLYLSYLPLIEKDSLEGGQPDVVSLKLLLEQYARTGNFTRPEEGYKLLI